MDSGIVVGCDERQEWLLSWWWEQLRQHDAHPVAFFDFGLSKEAKKWCRQRGKLFSLAEQKEGEALSKSWEERYGKNLHLSRPAWFKKPLACLHSPWKQSVWLDLDCEVRRPIDLLFQAPSIALAKDLSSPGREYTTYNSGVIAFPKNCPVIREWARRSLQNTELFCGDQDLLSHVIFDTNAVIHELRAQYNWPAALEADSSVVIRHYVGEMGKMALRYHCLVKTSVLSQFTLY